MIPLRKRKAMALPLTLIFLLVGAVLVGTALYVVEKRKKNLIPPAKG